MKAKITKQVSLRNLNQDKKISKTGYRALLLLMMLLKSPMSRDEILGCFKRDKIIGDSLSVDSVTNTINTLRKVGCKINRPSQKTNFCYVLLSHPFSSFLTKADVEVLQNIREIISNLDDWELLLNLNDFYKKLSKYVCDEKSKNNLVYNHKLKNINLEILKELLANIAAKKQINLTYFSPKEGKENLDFLPENITFENGKLYLWGLSQKYQSSTYLRIDRIKEINFVRLEKASAAIEPENDEMTEVVYCLKNMGAILYTENEEEEIISKDNNEQYSLTIKAKVTNKFNFFQKILYHGTDCKIISPDSIIKEFKHELAKMKSVYSYGN